MGEWEDALAYERMRREELEAALADIRRVLCLAKDYPADKLAHEISRALRLASAAISVAERLEAELDEAHQAAQERSEKHE